MGTSYLQPRPSGRKLYNIPGHVACTGYVRIIYISTTMPGRFAGELPQIEVTFNLPWFCFAGISLVRSDKAPR
jgi:hypothetical protein